MLSEPEWYFWVLWGLTAAAVAVPIVRALFVPTEVLTLPFLAGGMFAYFFVYMAWGAARELHEFLPGPTLPLGQALALACFVALLFGWYGGKRTQAAASDGEYDATRLRWVSTALVLIGTVGYTLFRTQTQSDYQGTSAYWYLIFHLGYAGIALYIVLLVQTRAPRSQWLFLALLVAVHLAPHLLYARRGPVFPAAVILLLVPQLLRRVVPSRAAVVIGLSVTGFAMLLFLAVRPYLYKPDTKTDTQMVQNWSVAISNVTSEEILSTRIRKLSDNEYVFHSALVTTASELGLYQYGTSYLYLLVHWVPRQAWPGKPLLGQGAFEDPLPALPAVFGWTPSVGSAATGVAESFVQLGYAAPLLWFAIGRGMRRLFERSRAGSVKAVLAYAGSCAAAHWAVSQGIIPAFVPLCIYLIVPRVSLWLSRRAPVLPSPQLEGAGG